MIKLAGHELISLAVYGLINSKEQARSILGVSDGASDDDIRKAFKLKSQSVHPDKNKDDPNATISMQMLVAARDFLLNTDDPILTSEIPDVSDDPYNLTYEQIAEMRKEMGREEFNVRFPGWETELQQEMGLDQWNDLFEGYEPGYDPNDDPSYQNDMDQMWDRLRDEAADDAYILFERGMEDGKIDFYTNVTDLMVQYPNLITFRPWIIQRGLKKDFEKLLVDKFSALILENVDNFDITFDDMIAYPNDKVIASFLSKKDNIEKSTIPDKLLSQKEFITSIIFLIANNFEAGKRFVNKYRHNKHFIEGIMKCVGFLYWLRNNEDAKNLILNLPFTESQHKIVERWLSPR